MRLLYTIINNFEFLMDIPSGLIHPIENYSSKNEETIIYFKSNYYFNSVLKNRLRELLKLKQSHLVIFLPIESLFKEGVLNNHIIPKSPISYGLVFSFFEIGLFKITVNGTEISVSEENSSSSSFADYYYQHTSNSLRIDELVFMSSKQAEIIHFFTQNSKIAKPERKQQDLRNSKLIDSISFEFIKSFLDSVFVQIALNQFDVFYYGDLFNVFEIENNLNSKFNKANKLVVTENVNISSLINIPIENIDQKTSISTQTNSFGEYKFDFLAFYGSDFSSLKKICVIKNDLTNAFLETPNNIEYLI